ncbi:MAG: D-glycero-beta-D-manno-heptose 1-phosphate adenylyltransferase [Pseudanabaena sp. ELA607]
MVTSTPTHAINLVWDLATLQQAIAADPEQWRPLVFTNGCFDLLHVGHIRYLQAAKALGKTLVIGLNSDSSVQALKGASRPIVPQSQRAEMLAALKSVDGVVIFAETTASNLLLALKPDIYVKGGDYAPNTLPEMPAVEAVGATLRLIQIEIPTSTSQIIARIRQQ